MTPSVAILDADGIDRLAPPATEREGRARRWAAALARAGPRHFVDNAYVAARAVVVDGKTLPLLLANGTPGTADVCSPSSHYIAYTLEEFVKRHRLLPAVLPRALMLPLRAILAVGRIDHVAFVNNWLLATNPGHGLSSVEIAAVTAHVAAAYPDAAMVFRSNNPRFDPDGVGRLRENGYRLVRSRRVYLLDARNARYLRHENARIDRRLLEQSPYRIVEDRDVLLPQAARLAALYRGLYLHKHSRLNPQLNERFIALTLKERILTYRALVRDGRIDGFIAFFPESSVLTSAILGYDLGIPTETGLYRMLIALLLAEGAERRTVVNLSAGADRFKVLRGAVPVEEYDAVYDRHLPSPRRHAWTSLRLATDIWARARREPAVRTAIAADVDWDRAWERAWRPHPANAWFNYQAAACAAWVRARAPAAVPHAGARVLKTDAFDEACGFDPLRAVIGKVPRVLMDISPRIASSALQAEGTIRGACATDVRAIAFRPASFDLVYSPSTLDHFADERDIGVALRELRTVLRPGAHMLVTLDNPANPVVGARNALFRLTGSVGALIPFPMGRTLSRARLVTVLAGAGFQVLQSGYVVHAPRILGLWLGEWAARRGRRRLATRLQALLVPLDRALAALPTRRWTGYFVIADCRRKRRR